MQNEISKIAMITIDALVALEPVDINASDAIDEVAFAHSCMFGQAGRGVVVGLVITSLADQDKTGRLGGILIVIEIRSL